MFVGLTTCHNLHQSWCAVLGLNQRTSRPYKPWTSYQSAILVPLLRRGRWPAYPGNASVVGSNNDDRLFDLALAAAMLSATA
jgi:hypothetical protein